MRKKYLSGLPPATTVTDTNIKLMNAPRENKRCAHTVVRPDTNILNTIKRTHNA